MAGSVGRKMNKTLGHTPLVEVLAPSIKDDATIKAAAYAVDAALLPVVSAIPRMLLWARLWQDERGLSPSLRRIVHFCGGLPPLSDEELELLAWQMHVDFWDPAWPRSVREHLVKYATAWHRIKGTPAGVIMALRLFDVQAQVDESGRGDNWAVYELELEAVPRGLLPTIAGVAEEMAPARCRLRRVYGGFDRRPIILDVGPALDVGFLDDDSGIWDADTGIKESFGENVPMLAKSQPASTAHIGSVHTHASRAFYVDKAILDQWRLDNPTVKSYGFIGGSLVSLLSVGIQGNKWRWEGPWDHRKWNDCDGYPGYTPMPRRRIDNHRSVSKSQLVLDFGRLDSSLERLDRQQVTVVDNPHRLDFSRLDRGLAELSVRRFIIDERCIMTTRGVARAERPDMSLCSGNLRGVFVQRAQGVCGVGVTTYSIDTVGLMALRRPYSLPDGTEWTGPWSHRTWRTMGIPVNITTTGGSR